MTDRPHTNELRELLLEGKRNKRSKGQIIQSTDSQRTVNLVTSGYIKRYLISNAGTLGVEVIYGPGNVFPITLMMKALVGLEVNQSPETYYYEAMTDTEFYTIDIAFLVENVKKNPLLYRELLLECGKRLHSTLNGLENVTLRTSYKRVAHQLVYFAEEFGEKKLTGVKIRLPLTHQDLADTLSLTRETVSTCVARLREQKLIKTGRYIMIPDLEKLKEEAHS
jgi:CRP/FNR family transcriptional regulator